MSDSLGQAIESVKSMDREGNVHALAEADLLIARHPSEAKVWSLRSYLHARRGKYEEALADMTEATRLAPEEIAYRFDRGRYSIRVENFDQSIEDFSEGLVLCDRHQHDYYRDALHFFRAFARIKMGNKVDAAWDLSKVTDDDYSFWIDGLISKKELMELSR